jgi:hypothetical protein
MSIINRRNAVIGWATWSVGKRLVKRKARSVLPSREAGVPDEAGGKKKKAVKAIAVVAAAGGALAFWKAKHRDSTDHDSIAAEEIGARED